MKKQFAVSTPLPPDTADRLARYLVKNGYQELTGTPPKILGKLFAWYKENGVAKPIGPQAYQELLSQVEAEAVTTTARVSATLAASSASAPRAPFMEPFPKDISPVGSGPLPATGTSPASSPAAAGGRAATPPPQPQQMLPPHTPLRVPGASR